MRREGLEKSYRAYVTDALNAIPQNKYAEKRWIDLIEPAPDIDADRVISNVIDKAGLIVT